VILSRVDDELRGDVQRLERLVHLFAAQDGDVEVVLPAHEERRGLDAIGLEERIGEPDPEVDVLPRWPELAVVEIRVLVVAVERDVVGASGAADGRLEARVAGDHVVGREAAVAPAADPQAIGIGDALRDGVIGGGQDIVDLESSPVGEDRLLELRPAPGAAAVVHVDDRVTVCGEDLPLEGKGMCVLGGGATVNPEQRGIAPAADVSDRTGEQRVDLRAVLAAEGEVLGGLKLKLRQQRVVMRGQRAQRPSLDRVQLTRLGRGAGRHDDPPRGERRLADDAWPVGEASDVATADRHAGQVDGTVVGDGEDQLRPVGGEARQRGAAVERLGQQLRCSPVHPNDGELRETVEVHLRLAPLSVGDARAIGAPGEGTDAVGTREAGRASGAGPRLRLHDEDIGIARALPVVVVVADESEASAVGRPGGCALLEVPIGGEQLGLLLRDVIQEEPRARRPGEVGGAVTLELILVDDDRRRRFRRG
jgi:hypothetical protein